MFLQVRWYLKRVSRMKRISTAAGLLVSFELWQEHLLQLNNQTVKMVNIIMLIQVCWFGETAIMRHLKSGWKWATPECFVQRCFSLWDFQRMFQSLLGACHWKGEKLVYHPTHSFKYHRMFLQKEKMS